MRAKGPVQQLVQANPDAAAPGRLEQLVDAYNLGTLDAEAFFAALKKLIEQMEDEERRAAREQLTEGELAIFDLLTRPEPKATKAQEAEEGRARPAGEVTGAARWSSGARTNRLGRRCTRRSASSSTTYRRAVSALWDRKVEAVWQFIHAHGAHSAAAHRMH